MRFLDLFAGESFSNGLVLAVGGDTERPSAFVNVVGVVVVQNQRAALLHLNYELIKFHFLHMDKYH